MSQAPSHLDLGTWDSVGIKISRCLGNGCRSPSNGDEIIPCLRHGTRDMVLSDWLSSISNHDVTKVVVLLTRICPRENVKNLQHCVMAQCCRVLEDGLRKLGNDIQFPHSLRRLFELELNHCSIPHICRSFRPTCVRQTLLA